MTYDECANLVTAFESAVEIADFIDTEQDEKGEALSNAIGLRNALGGFIASLLFESPIGDGYRGRA